jgi:flagellar motor switch protein FliN/FliY
MLEENKEPMEETTEEIQSELQETQEAAAESQEATQEAGSEASSEGSQESDSAEEMSPEDLMALWEEALKEAQAAETKTEEKKEEPPSSKESIQTQPASLEELTPAQASGVHPELEFILDIPLEVTVEIGRTRMMIRDLLKLNQGSIIELEKFVGEPVEVLVNGKLMAKGEVVVVNDRFGVRITEIISAKERIKKLGS